MCHGWYMTLAVAHPSWWMACNVVIADDSAVSAVALVEASLWIAAVLLPTVDASVVIWEASAWSALARVVASVWIAEVLPSTVVESVVIWEASAVSAVARVEASVWMAAVLAFTTAANRFRASASANKPSSIRTVNSLRTTPIVATRSRVSRNTSMKVRSRVSNISSFGAFSTSQKNIVGKTWMPSSKA